MARAARSLLPRPRARSVLPAPCARSLLPAALAACAAEIGGARDEEPEREPGGRSGERQRAPAPDAAADPDVGSCPDAGGPACSDAGVPPDPDAGLAPYRPCPDRCVAPPPEADEYQREMFRAVAEVRGAVGVPCAVMSEELDRAAQGHADYGARHAGDAGCAAGGHTQVPGCQGFTGASPWDRIEAAGYACGSGSSEIVHYRGDPREALEGWLGTLWHRVPLVHPNTFAFGYGRAQGWDVVDFGVRRDADPAGVWFYPPDGATGVPPLGGDERPPPPPPPGGCPAGGWGTFVTVFFDSGAAVAIDTHELRGPDGPVPHRWVTEDPSLAAGTVALVPCALDRGASYTVRIAGRLGGRVFSREATFTTR